MHGGTSPEAPKGNSRAFKHGRFTAEAFAGRREFAAWRGRCGTLSKGRTGFAGLPVAKARAAAARKR
jgi:hypothetical protein